MNINFRYVGLGLLVLGAWFLWRRWTVKTDLQTHMEAEASLDKAAQVATLLDNAALADSPLTTVGNTPLAGIHIDPFQPDSIAARPSVLEWAQGIVQARPANITSLITSWVN